jgi:light-regulated signal transduction histidine kinase (bacteriophytochrome)
MDGYARILIEDFAPKLEADAARYLGRVRDSALQMGRLIDDLLAFSRLSRQAMQEQPVSVTKLVREVLSDLRDEQGDRQIEVSVEDLPDCVADRALLERVFTNLLSNALKFTRNRRPARIEVGTQREAGEAIYFVRDNGVGFDMRYADKLFGVFQRLHRAEEFKGTGVGLVIVQRIVHRHGGHIWAEAELDKGATFYFTLKGGVSNGNRPG